MMMHLRMRFKSFNRRMKINRVYFGVPIHLNLKILNHSKFKKIYISLPIPCNKAMMTRICASGLHKPFKRSLTRIVAIKMSITLRTLKQTNLCRKRIITLVSSAPALWQACRRQSWGRACNIKWWVKFLSLSSLVRILWKRWGLIRRQMPASSRDCRASSTMWRQMMLSLSGFWIYRALSTWRCDLTTTWIFFSSSALKRLTIS